VSVVLLPGVGKRSPDAILEAAKNLGFEDVIVLGRDGDNITISASYGDPAHVLWELVQAQYALMDV
jgi:hypothetical protein